tara:strand:- start:711 stop:1535 length:825 start_codon:yes stop_codon:yes gene_type:complete
MRPELKIKLDKRSKYLRSLVVRSLVGGGRGHMGSAMSLIEMLRVLYDDIVKFNPVNPKLKNRDRVILSKGHGCLALYAILADKGFFKKAELNQASKLESMLGGHPESIKVKGVEASTGALGHGICIGVGMAIAAKIKKQKHKVFVVLGDGEINEGSIWEAALSASKHRLNNLKILLDYNKIQSYGPVKEVLNLEPLRNKWKSFGFDVSEVNGHSVKEIKLNLKKFMKNKKNKPSITICNTVKGKGFYFAENNPKWHHRNSFTEKEIANFNKCLI